MEPLFQRDPGFGRHGDDGEMPRLLKLTNELPEAFGREDRTRVRGIRLAQHQHLRSRLARNLEQFFAHIPDMHMNVHMAHPAPVGLITENR